MLPLARGWGSRATPPVPGWFGGLRDPQLRRGFGEAPFPRNNGESRKIVELSLRH
jgi:hypothetical protein